MFVSRKSRMKGFVADDQVRTYTILTFSLPYIERLRAATLVTKSSWARDTR